jgi:hypothetical protein
MNRPQAVYFPSGVWSTFRAARASSGLLKERSLAQVQLGKAEAVLRSGRLLLLNTVKEAWQRSVDGGTHSLKHKADRAWFWKKVVPLLRQRGHLVFTETQHSIGTDDLKTQGLAGAEREEDCSSWRWRSACTGCH